MIQIPCDIKEVENISIDVKNGLIELTIMVNNEKVQSTRYLFHGLITKHGTHPDQSVRQGAAI